MTVKCLQIACLVRGRPVEIVRLVRGLVMQIRRKSLQSEFAPQLFHRARHNLSQIIMCAVIYCSLL